jgi:glyoxylase-like metal-dependent hydrolase (beta-lactamase superfamily II)
MEIKAVGPFFKNGFVIGCEQTREAVLIDPGDEVAQLLAAAGKQSLSIRHILLTHAHIDHITGVDAARKALDVPVYLHHDDCSFTSARSRWGRCSA